LRGKVRLGKLGLRGEALARAPVRALASLMLCDSLSFAACTSDRPLLRVSRLFSAFHRARDAASLRKPFSSSD
jgi:hypothetical protein